MSQVNLRPTHLERAARKSVGTALVMTGDNRLMDQFSKAFKAIDVSTVTTSLVRDSLELIHGQKFEAFVLDTTIDSSELDLLTEVRSSSSNSKAVIVGVAPSGPIVELARQSGANFVLEQPVNSETIDRTLRAAYGMIVRECRRYFRSPLRGSATVWSAVTGDIQGEMVDISEEGIGIRLSYFLGVDTEVIARFKLPPNTKEIYVRAKVSRTGEGGLAGFTITEISSQAKAQLHEWLSHRLEEKIPALASKQTA